MNINRMKASAIRYQMEMQAMAKSEGKHTQHIRDYCDYADATAEAVAEGVLQELPQAV